MIHIQDDLQNAKSYKIPDHVFASVLLRSNITLSVLSTQSLEFKMDHLFLLDIQYTNTLPEPTPNHLPIPNSSPLPGPIPFHVQRLQTPEIVLQYQKHWTMREDLFTFYKGSESVDLDMLDSILCSAVQAVGESVLGIYPPAKARKAPDNTAKELSKQLDMNASIQLLKRAQGASSIAVHLVSSTDQSTPMEECIKHYTTMFNPLIPSSNHTFYSPTSFTVPASEPLLSIPKVPSINAIPLFSSLNETTLLDPGLLDQISPDKIKFQLSRMSTTSSCSTDGITVIMLRYLQDTSFTEHLYQLYTACLRKGETP